LSLRLSNSRSDVVTPKAAQQRLDLVKGLPSLDVNKEAISIAEKLKQNALPHAAIEDALHIAVAGTHRMKHLLTWNCRHIANAAMRQSIYRVFLEAGYEPPQICTPPEL
jgi:hypothetical protein